MTRQAKQALAALTGERWLIPVAEARVPRAPGLYAIHGSDAVWRTLGLGKPPDDRPLYVGKAEDSLASRDIRTHFGDGRTGSSTVRRSFAALLRDTLALRALPRNPAKPERFANYGLSMEDDRKLTAWMREHLLLAVWPSPPGVVLGAVETEVMQQLQPPLNLTKITTQWTAAVSTVRAVMATEARAWAEDQGSSAPRGSRSRRR